MRLKLIHRRMISAAFGYRVFHGCGTIEHPGLSSSDNDVALDLLVFLAERGIGLRSN